MKKKQREYEAELIIANTDKDANMLYATGLFAPDAFIYFNTYKGSAVVMSDLEYGRALKKARVNKVYSLSKLREEVKINKKRKTPWSELVDVATLLFKKEGVKSLLVPANFPIQYADPLRKNFTIKYKTEPFFDKRALKTEQEVDCIKKSMLATEKGFKAALRVLQDSTIGDDKRIYYHGKVLKAEDLRSVINSTITSMGYTISHTIVACGNQACDPHNEGSGILKANQTIILDIFPRSDKTGYYADFTRTVVKGKANDDIKKAYRAVREGQNIAFSMIRDGVEGSKVHKTIRDYFKDIGFPVIDKKGGKEGFIHGTGHGVGLDLHEYPTISERACKLKAGNVVTVEPGLYYQGLGGIRLEDMVVVTKVGCRNLTKISKVLEVE